MKVCTELYGEVHWHRATIFLLAVTQISWKVYEFSMIGFVSILMIIYSYKINMRILFIIWVNTTTGICACFSFVNIIALTKIHCSVDPVRRKEQIYSFGVFSERKFKSAPV